MTTLIIILLVILILICIFIIYNLNRKITFCTALIDDIFYDISERILYSNRKLQEIDIAGHFEADDEVGYFFKNIKEIQQILNEYSNTYFINGNSNSKEKEKNK